MSSSLYGSQSSGGDLTDDWLFISPDSARPEVLEVSRNDQEEEDRGKLRSKLVSAWNSVKYAGWTVRQKSKFSKSSPVTVLGKSFNLKDQGGLSGDTEHFRRSFGSLLWLTYRKGFPPLGGCSLTSDSGWGCVLRTGQMLLAKGLLLHLLPPGWTWSATHHEFKDDMDLERQPSDRELSLKEGPNKRGRKLSLGSLLDRPMEPTHRRVVSWFADQPSAPFGIHQLVELGKSSGKKAGDWYGPSIVAHILQKAVTASADLPSLAVYVAQDCTIYVEDVRRLCERPPPQSWRSVIILVPVRLGGQDLNAAYVTCVKKLLTLQCCIGIIGGKPKHSLYFIGFQDDKLLYLDPHYCQPTVDMTQKNFSLESFHCKYPRTMSVSRMDPSCTIGFYAKGQKDFEVLCTVVTEALSTSAGTYPMFIFAEGHRQEEEEDNPPTNVTYIHRQKKHKKVEVTTSLDEFVVL